MSDGDGTVSRDELEGIRGRKVSGTAAAAVLRENPNSRPGCFYACLVVSLSVILISRFLSPSDWVDVTVGPLPKNTYIWCVIAEDSHGMTAIPWYHSKVIPFVSNPFRGGNLLGGMRDVDHDGFVKDSIQWSEAKRYGVLLQRTDDQWQLYWLEPEEVFRPSIMRYIVGGGHANLHLPAETRAEVPSKQLLKRLGYTP